MQNEKFNLKSVYGYKFIVYASAVSVQLSVPFLLFFIPIIIAGAGCTSACVRLRLRACKRLALYCMDDFAVAKSTNTAKQNKQRKKRNEMKLLCSGR